MQQARGNEETILKPASPQLDPAAKTAPASHPPSSLIDDVPAQPLISFSEPSTPLLQDAGASTVHSLNLLPLTSSTTAPPPGPRQTQLDPSTGFLDELLDHEDDPMYFQASRSASTSRTPTPQPLRAADLPRTSRPARHPTRESNWTELGTAHAPSPPKRSPSLPPSPMRISNPEVQKTQSFFMPTTFTPSSFPTRWVSSLLSRPAPSVQPPSAPANSIEGLPAQGRAATAPGAMGITHGTPFAAHPYIPPSGAPGFAGDRAWNKGFEFDKENVARASVTLAGRKAGAHGLLTVALADQVRRRRRLRLRAPPDPPRSCGRTCPR